MRVFTVLGPSHAGKSTLVDAMAAIDGGRSDTFTGAGGARVKTFTFMGEDWGAIDVPGGPDAMAAAGPALAASDAAVLCVPPEAEAAVLSAPYLRLFEEAGIPCFLFVNKVDAAEERIRDIVAGLQAYCAHSIVLRQIPMREGDAVVGAVDLISERAWKYNEGQPSSLVELPDSVANREQEARTELLESLSDYDDALLEQLIEDQAPVTDEVFAVATRILREHELVPAYLGAASHANGVFRLMKALRHEAPDPALVAERLGASGNIAVACAADMVKHLGKTIVVRALGDGVAQGASLGGANLGGLTALDGKTALGSLAPGSLGLTLKSDHLRIGQAYSAEGSSDLPSWAAPRPGSYRRIVTPSNERDEARLSSALARLTEIDTGVTVEPDPQTGHAVLSAQGVMHARHLIEKLASEFGIDVTEEPVPPMLRETVSKPVEKHHRHRKQSGGAGQFADVLIDLKPLPRGSGFQFDEIVKGGAVPRNYIPAVEHGAQDALAEGPHGFPVVDVSVTLKDGKHHSVDSSDFAFRTAGKNAVKEALAEAGPLVLQPIMRVQIHVPSVYAGGLVPLVSGLKGQVLGFEGHPTAAGWDVFNTLLPMSSGDELFRALGSATRGTAWFTGEFDHYEELRNFTPEMAAAG